MSLDKLDSAEEEVPLLLGLSHLLERSWHHKVPMFIAYCCWCTKHSSVHFSHVRLSATPWTAACQDSLSFTNSWSLLELMSIKLVTPFNHFILCRLLLLPSTFPSVRWDAEDWLQVTSLVRLSMKELGKWIKPVHLILHLLPEMLQTLTVGKNYRSLKGTEIRKLKTKKLKTIFSSESILHIRWPKYWSFSFSISHSNEYSWLISFRIDWLDLLSVHGTLKSLLQHHSSKASILQCSAFFMVQLSHPYTTTEKIIALTRWTLLAK